MTPSPYEPPKSDVRDVAPGAQAMTRPQQVRWAANCLWASIAIGAVTAALELLWIETAALLWWAWLFPAGILGVMALFTMAIHAGTNWARIVFLVLFVVGTLPYLVTLAEMFARSALAATLSLVQLLLQAAALYLVFTKPGSLWYRRA